MSLLPDAAALTKLIKKVSIQTVEAAKPMKVCFGKVLNTTPLTILIDQKMTLGEAQLILSRHVTEHEIKIKEKDREQTILIKNELVIGEEVILLQQKGGQSYIVWDRVGET